MKKRTLIVTSIKFSTLLLPVTLVIGGGLGGGFGGGGFGGGMPGGTAASANAGEKWTNVDYAGDDIIGHKMDIYLPKDANDAPFPVIISIGGSAWLSNNVKGNGPGRNGLFLDEGFALVNVNHRSSGEAKFPAQINDIKGAVRFLRANAQKYKLDTRFIGMMGDSSGGHLAALMGTSNGVKEHTINGKTLDIEGNVGGNEKESSNVNAVIDLFGPTVFYKMNSQRTAGGMDHDGAGSPESSLIGGAIQENHDLCDFANPLTYIDENDPSFLIIHGDSDALVPLGQSTVLKEALTEKKVKNELLIVEGGQHEDGRMWQPPYSEKMIEFFTQERDKKTDTNPSSSKMSLVYEVEDTGADVPKPQLPEFSKLESIPFLPDPFMKADGTRITTRDEWRVRRAEIKAMIERYIIGEKPGKPSKFEAKLDGNTIRITVGEGDNSFEMSAVIARPAGAPDAPVPAIIGMNSPTGSLPRNLFSDRGIATITFRGDQVAPTGFGGVNYESGHLMKLYPSATAGYMLRWAWGVSRIIDALQALPEAKIDTKRLAVSGCSFQGKMALYAGAFDERIALTIPHESGGGGTISWRYSDMLEKRDNVEVENLLHAQGGSEDFPWYARALRQFNKEPGKLPVDHHELIAMIAPRAVLMIESTQVARMGAEAARIDALAAREVYRALGVPDRIGVTEDNVAHCSWSQKYTPVLEAYLDKFLLGKEDAGPTEVLQSKFTDLDTKTWIPWSTPELK